MSVVTSSNTLFNSGEASPTLMTTTSDSLSRLAVESSTTASRLEPIIKLVQRTDSQRAQVEQFIAAGFAAAYQANIQHFMPQLLTVSARDTLQAVLGVRGGQSEKLFVEQYLDADISFVLRDIGIVTSRAQIAEIGNLYAANRHYTLLLFVVTAYALYQAGFRHLVCCATPQVQHLLSRHGLQLQTLAEGDPARLTGNASAWGTYYQSHPMVCHLDLEQAITLISADVKLNQLTQQFWPAGQPQLDGQALEN